VGVAEPANSQTLLSIPVAVCPGVGRNHMRTSSAREDQMGFENRYDGIDPYAVRLSKPQGAKLVGHAGFTESDREDLEQEIDETYLAACPVTTRTCLRDIPALPRWWNTLRHDRSRQKPVSDIAPLQLLAH